MCIQNNELLKDITKATYKHWNEKYIATEKEKLEKLAKLKEKYDKLTQPIDM